MKPDRVHARPVALDAILDELGHFGRFQRANYLLIVLPVLATAVFTTSYVFTAADTHHRCLRPECETKNTTVFNPSWLQSSEKINAATRCQRFPLSNATLAWRDSAENQTLGWSGGIAECSFDDFDRSRAEACDSWIYKDRLTIVSEFNLACQDWKRTLVGTVHNSGQFVCLPLTGLVSDRFGRRTALVGGIVLSGIVGLIRAFSPDYWSFLFLEFLDPALGSGAYSSAFILGVELVGPKYRVISGTMIASFYAVGEIMLGVTAMHVPYWRHLLMLLYAPAILLICYFWFIPESVRWLLTKGKTEAARDVLTKAAQFNKVVLSDKSMENLYYNIEQDKNNIEMKTIHVKDAEIAKQESYFKQVLKSPRMVIRIAVCSFWWITCTFTYYGLSLNSVSLNGNIYMNFILVSLAEIPGYVTTALAVDRFGRRLCLSLSFLAAGVALLAFGFVPDDPEWLRLALFMWGKFAITISFTVLYVYTTELYPTPVRHSLLGTCSMFGRIGAILAPQTPLLSAIYPPLPTLMFGTTAVISGISVLGFPETLNTQLPETIEDALNLSHNKKTQTPVNTT